ncbi:MAG: glutamate 5-kinase [Thermodesulfovibrionales bacterium]|nr:glutamate 5-kinase [Thermodesulfovibrionales bacterium]
MVNRIVIKIGSNILTDKTGKLDIKRIRHIAEDVVNAIDLGNDVLIVSSGAIAAGMGKLGLKQKPDDIQLKQAAAAVGQPYLMRAYERVFSRFSKKVGQILLTRSTFSDRRRYLNAKNTLLTLLSYKIIPIINENDTVSTEEIKFGDNDQLAALVSGLINADRLIILSDVEGLYSADPKKNPDAKMFHLIDEITPEIEAMAGGAGSVVGTGGMYSKVLAAKKATSFGVRVNIISGREKGLITAVLKNEPHGTEFKPQDNKISSKKGWIAYAIRSNGNIILDDGAIKAILYSGKSLLPSGILKVEGYFDIGDGVNCLDVNRKRVAKGIVNYSSFELNRIKGKKTNEIESVLGYKYSDEVIHRDNLVIIA